MVMLSECAHRLSIIMESANLIAALVNTFNKRECIGDQKINSPLSSG